MDSIFLQFYFLLNKREIKLVIFNSSNAVAVWSLTLFFLSTIDYCVGGIYIMSYQYIKQCH